MQVSESNRVGVGVNTHRISNPIKAGGSINFEQSLFATSGPCNGLNPLMRPSTSHRAIIIYGVFYKEVRFLSGVLCRSLEAEQTRQRERDHTIKAA